MLAHGPYGMKTTFGCGPLNDFTAFTATEPKSVVTLTTSFSLTPRSFMSSGSISQIDTLFKYSLESLPHSFPLPWSIVLPVNRETWSVGIVVTRDFVSLSESLTVSSMVLERLTYVSQPINVIYARF